MTNTFGDFHLLFGVIQLMVSMRGGGFIAFSMGIEQGRSGNKKALCNFSQDHEEKLNSRSKS